jgi:hypothetical protein
MDDPSSLIYSYEGNFIEGNYRMPKTLIWTVSGEHIQKIEAAGLKNFQVGTIGGDFHVTSWTNIDGQSLPLEFELVRSAVPGPGVLERYNGVVKRIATMARQAGPPEIRSPVGVADYRWQDPNVGLYWLNYPITNGIWRGSQDTYLETMFQKRRGNMPLKPPLLTSRKYIVVVVVFVTFLVVPPVWILLSRRGFSKRRI